MYVSCKNPKNIGNSYNWYLTVWGELLHTTKWSQTNPFLYVSFKSQRERKIPINVILQGKKKKDMEGILNILDLLINSQSHGDLVTSEDLKYVKKIDLHLNADLNFSLGTTKKPFRRKGQDQQNMKSLQQQTF